MLKWRFSRVRAMGIIISIRIYAIRGIRIDLFMKYVVIVILIETVFSGISGLSEPA